MSDDEAECADLMTESDSASDDDAHEEDIFEMMSRIVSQGSTESELRRATEQKEEAEHEYDLAAASAAAAAADAAAASSSSSTTTTDSTLARRGKIAKHMEHVSFHEESAIEQYESDASIVCASDKFAAIYPTTFGLSGEFSNVSLNESTIMPQIEGKLSFPCLCVIGNYGIVKIPNFDEVIAEYGISMASSEKSARARAKKKERAGSHARKVQGNGTCFCSSVLFWVYSEKHRVVYKFLLFRTGKFNLPGTKPEMLRDILDICNQHLIPTLKNILTVRDQPPPDIALVMLASVMKNYKWRRFILPNMILDLHAISERMQADPATSGLARPYEIKYVHFGICDSKLPIKFITPLPERAGKTVRVNIFLSGKINILGAHSTEVTKKICDYLSAVLTDDMVLDPCASTSSRARALSDDDLPSDDERLF